MDTFILALQLFTNLPVNKSVEVTDKRLIDGVVCWPVIGWIIGLFDALIYIMVRTVAPRAVAAGAALLAELWMTRGFHLDGLCDTADAFYSSRNRERMLEIMKDSRIGTFGVIAAVADIGFKYIFLMTGKYPILLLLAAPAAGKMVQALLMYKADYPRDSGLGKSYIGRISAGILLSSTALGAVGISILLVYACGVRYMVVPAAALLAAWLFRRACVKKIGGMTGDTMGAGSEIIGIVTMFVMVALEGGGWL